MFFFPLFDDNPPGRPPFICWAIMVACILAFLWQMQLPAPLQQEHVYQYGFIPARLSGVAGFPHHAFEQPVLLTMATSWFMHGGWLHIGSNMLYLWIFGDNVEDSMGAFRFVVFYFLCGVAATLSHYMIDPLSGIPLVGASGAIAGVLGAYILLHPGAAVRTLVIILIFFRFISVPAWLVLGVWIAGQFLAVSAPDSGSSGVAYLAHIGGFFAGMVLIPLFKRPEVRLFGRDDPPKHAWDGRPIPFEAIRQEARHKYTRSGRTALGSRVVSKEADRPMLSDKPRGLFKRRGSVPQHKRKDRR